MTPPEGRGSLKHAIDELEALEKTIHPTLHVFRYWRPDMALPALWNWMPLPGDVEVPDAPACRVKDTLRITVTVAADPTAVPGEGDMLELEEYVELALDVLDPVIYSRRPFGQTGARRRGFSTVTDRLGDVVFLCIEIPLEIDLERVITPVQ